VIAVASAISSAVATTATVSEELTGRTVSRLVSTRNVARVEPAPFTPEDLIRLATWHMPFGKYQGTVLADLPGPYLGWFARTGFPDGEIGHLLAVMHEISHNGLRDLLTPLRQPRPASPAR
jgi:uncharacterized protein (DUF3820 family)